MRLSIKFWLINVALILIIYSCKKDVASIPETPVVIAPNPTVLAPDSIYHKILSPYIVLNPVLYLQMHPSGCGMVNFPSDSLTSYNLDLDSNGVDDVTFSSTLYYETHSASWPCANYMRNTNIGSIATSCLLGHTGLNSTTINYYFSLGDTINNNTTFHNSLGFSVNVWQSYSHPLAIHGGDFYLPIKQQLNSKTMYGWIKIDTIGLGGIIIKEYAINSTNNKPIRCGQIY